MIQYPMLKTRGTIRKEVNLMSRQESAAYARECKWIEGHKDFIRRLMALSDAEMARLMDALDEPGE